MCGKRLWAQQAASEHFSKYRVTLNFKIVQTIDLGRAQRMRPGRAAGPPLPFKEGGPSSAASMRARAFS